MPNGFKIKGNRLRIPKMGWVNLRRRGGKVYPDQKAIRVTVKLVKEKRYAVVLYRLEAQKVRDNGVVCGVDRNGRGMIAVAYSDDTPLEVREAQQIAYYTRKLVYWQKVFSRLLRFHKKEGRTHLSRRARQALLRVQKWHKKLADIHRNQNHHNSRHIVNPASTVVVEDLHIETMTSTAKGTVENPGRNVRQKAGLNRVFRQEGAPGQLKKLLLYKAYAVLSVSARNTSLTCSQCGEYRKDNRPSLRKFRCVYCGCAVHTDINAAVNILARGLGSVPARGGLNTRTV